LDEKNIEKEDSAKDNKLDFTTKINY